MCEGFIDSTGTQRGDTTLMLHAERPDLVRQVAEMQWSEWGTSPGRERLSWWIEANSRTTGRNQMPVGLVAVDEQDRVLGSVSLAPVEHGELSDRGPWVQGMIVRSDRRGQGIGQMLVHALEAWASANGIARLWVCNEGPAVGFYERCGWLRTEVAALNSGDLVTVLSRDLTAGTLSY